ncbi:uncharacterized protein LOC118203541 [Stegodyphus dumicola]|uniref:uncharacterized protein LOC118203541 n=1 Tax=Stegodyphus dumicola TaxID=202533 RepID=UPI0015ADB3CB|nr:uncharacterized protein LOC118203541 [Stegodyphus dumicola]
MIFCKELNFGDEVAPSRMIQAESFVLEKSILSPNSCSRSVLESTPCLRVTEGGVSHSNICGLSEENITFPNENQIPNYYFSGIRKNVAYIPIEESLKSTCSPSNDKINKNIISSFPLKQKGKINENLDSYLCNASGLCTPELKLSILQFENTIDKAEFGKVKEFLFPEKKEENIHKLFPKLTFNAISPEIERNHKITSASDQTYFFEKDGENDVVLPNNLETVLKYVGNSHVAHKTNEETVKNSKMINPDINRHEKSFISDKEFVKENAQVTVLEEYPLIGTAVKESYNKSSVLGNEKIVLLFERNTFNDGEGNSLADNEHKSSHSFKSPCEMSCNIFQTSSSASTKQLQTENDPIDFFNQIHEELSLDDEAAGLQVIQAESFNVEESISSLDVSNELFLESTPIFT